MLTTAIRTVSVGLSGLASAEGLVALLVGLGDSDGVALALGDAEGDVAGLAVAVALGVAEGDAVVVVFGVAEVVAVALGDVEAVGVLGVQETIATEKLVAIANPYKNDSFMNFLLVFDLKIDNFNIPLFPCFRIS